MTGELKNLLTASIFPTINAIIFLFLFWPAENYVSRDPLTMLGWNIGAFVIGFIIGIIIQLLSSRSPRFSQTRFKFVTLVGVIFLEAILILILIAPSLWLQLKFTPTSNIHSICCETPKEYGATNYENVHLNTDDGGFIAGWYVAPTTQVGKVIILIHGYGYDRRGTDFQTRALIAAGYGVLLYDLRDHGESIGKINAFNRMNIYQSDLKTVIHFLKQKPEINPEKIGVVGISLGAFATLNSTPETLNALSALWLDGLRFENFGAKTQPKTPTDYLKFIVDHQARLLAGFYTEKAVAPRPLPFVQIIPQITHPKVMIVSSGLDDMERGTNEKLIPLMGGNKDIWFIKNAWHIGGRFEVPDEYREKLLTFFANAFKD